MLEASRVAAKWWADKLRSKHPHHDMGDALGNAFLSLCSSCLEPIPADLVDRFETELSRLIDEEIASQLPGPNQRVKGWAPRVNCQAETIYAPVGVLDDAMQAAGLADWSLAFPIYTGCSVFPDEVVVSEGYYAPRVTIWSAIPP
jgi:hypothetical protein